MKKTVRQYFILSLLLSVSILSIFAPLSHAAPLNHSIYVTPGSGSYQPGNSFTVIVNGYATATQFGAGQVNGTLTFPANLLRVTSVSTVGNPYQVNVSATPNNTAGTVAFNGQNYFGGPNDQTIQIMTVTFQTLGNGTANVGFTANTAFISSYNNYPTSLSGGNYSITTPPPPTCPSGQVGTPPNCTTPPPATCPSGQVGTPPNCTAPSTPKPTTPTSPVAVSPDTDPNIPIAAPAAVTPTVTDAGDLSIKNVTAKVSLKENTITWITTLPNVTSEIQLGTSKQNLTAKPSVIKVADGSFSATATSLVPGTRYYYTITATGSDNAEKKATYSGAFTTRGYPVKILVTQNGKPVSNTKVQVEKDSYITDKNGSLKLELASQDYHAIVTLADKTTKAFNFTVAKKNFAEGKTPEMQTFTFDATTKAAVAASSSPSPGLMIAAGVGGLLLVGGILLLLVRKRKNGDAVESYDVDTSSYTDPQVQQPQAQEYVANPEDQQLTAVSAIEQQYIQQPEAVVPSIAPEPAAIYEQQMATPAINETPGVEYENPAVAAEYAAPQPEQTEQYNEQPLAATEQYVDPVAAETVDLAAQQSTPAVDLAGSEQTIQEAYSEVPPQQEADDSQPEVTQYIEHSAESDDEQQSVDVPTPPEEYAATASTEEFDVQTASPYTEQVSDPIQSAEIPQDSATEQYVDQQPDQITQEVPDEASPTVPDQYLQGRPAV